jgi:hypothetical protein
MEKNISLNEEEDKEKSNKEKKMILSPSINKTSNFQLTPNSLLKSNFNQKRRISKEEKRRYIIKEKEKQKNEKLSKAHFWRKFNFEKKYNLNQQPQSPHNTGQYIIHMFNSKKQNDIFNFEDIDEIPQFINLKNSIEEENEMEFDLDDALGIENNIRKRERYMSAEYNLMPNNGFKLIKKEINDNNNNEINNDNDFNLKKYKSLFD